MLLENNNFEYNMKYAISSESMKLSDKMTIESGVSAIELMYRASHALFELIKDKKPNKIAIICGSGNNGGDGYSLALILAKNNFDIKVYGKLPKTESSKYYYNRLIAHFPDKFVDINTLTDLSEFDIVVDCLLGIGIKGNLTEEYIHYIGTINKSKYIISCDIASGLNSDNGLKSPVSVNASETLAIQSYKTGHFLVDGKDCSGKLVLCDIGIEIVGEKYYIIDDQFVKNNMPARLNNTHKGSFGRAGIVACSDNFVGAGLLAYQSLTSLLGECSMRVGCGYSYLYVPEKMIPAMWSRVTHSCIFSHNDIGEHKLDSLAFGMGIGENIPLFNKILELNLAKVIDADAINILAKNMDKITKLKGSVITPHIMEFSRLIGVRIEDILSDPITYAKHFAKKYQVILVLKSSATIVTDGVRVYINIEGCSGQAKGGSGDVLSGVITGLLAQKIDPFVASCMAVCITGKTAVLVGKKLTEYAELPMDIAKNIGNTLSKILL